MQVKGPNWSSGGIATAVWTKVKNLSDVTTTGSEAKRRKHTISDAIIPNPGTARRKKIILLLPKIAYVLKVNIPADVINENIFTK